MAAPHAWWLAWSWEEICQEPGKAVGMPGASKALKAWREAHSGEWVGGIRQTTREFEDITDGRLLN